MSGRCLLGRRIAHALREHLVDVGVLAGEAVDEAQPTMSPGQVHPSSEMPATLPRAVGQDGGIGLRFSTRTSW